MSSFITEVEVGGELHNLVRDQSEWSQATFGTDAERGPIGAIKHLQKEAAEALDAVGTDRFREEMADCFLLVLDAARRGGTKPLELIRAAQAKMEVNRARTWPKPVDDTPVEHVREVA